MLSIGFAVALAILQDSGTEVMQRYERNKQAGIHACFQSLADGDHKSGVSIVQAGTNAADLCKCVGDLWATSLISNQFGNKPASATAGTNERAALANLAMLCAGKLSK